MAVRPRAVTAALSAAVRLRANTPDRKVRGVHLTRHRPIRLRTAEAAVRPRLRAEAALHPEDTADDDRKAKYVEHSTPLRP